MTELKIQGILPTRIISRMKKIYYSPRGYYKGRSAIDKLAIAAKVPHDTAKEWLSKQATWQIYLPKPKSIKYGSFDVYIPNEVHQADILYLPHDSGYKYALTVVDIATRYKDAEPIMTKKSAEVAEAFKKIYKRGQLTWPTLLQVDPGNEFRGKVTSTMTEKNVTIRRGHTAIHRDQAIVERFNRTLADKLFSYQYSKEFIGSVNTSTNRSTEWVKRLPAVIKTINDEYQAKKIEPANLPEKRVPWDSTVRYLYEPGELEGGVRRSTDPVWSTTVHKIYGIHSSIYRPTYYTLDFNAPQRNFTHEQLLIIPDDTQLPPKNLK